MSGPNTAHQFSVATGEISPGIRNRIDWERRAAAVDELINGIVGPTGGATKRPGLRMHMECIHDDKPIRMIKFEFSKDQTYMLEFGDYVMRLHTDDGVITNPDWSDYICPTPFSAEQAQVMRACQDRDMLIFTHIDVPTQQLVRYGYTDWRWSQLFQDVDRIQSPTNVEFYDRKSNGHNGYEYTVTAYRTIDGAREESIGYQSVRADYPTASPISEEPYNNVTSCITWVKKYRDQFSDYSDFPTYPADMDISGIAEDTVGPSSTYAGPLNDQLHRILLLHYPNLTSSGRGYYTVNMGIRLRIWEWKLFAGSAEIFTTIYLVTNTNNNQNGVNSSLDDQWIGWVGGVNNTLVMWKTALDLINNNTVAIDGVTKSQLYESIGNFIEEYNDEHTQKLSNRIKWVPPAGAQGVLVYRRHIDSGDPNFYLIDDLPASTTDYTDENVEETVVGTQTPIAGENKFTDPDNYPAVCEFHQQRLVLGRTKSKPNSIFGSHTGIYTNFATNPSDPAAGYEFQMSSKQLNAIEDILSLKPFSLLTSGGDFVSTVSGAITAGNVNFDQHSYNGTSDIPAIVIGDAAIYVPLARQTIQSMTYSFDKDGFARVNILSNDQHRTKGKTVTCLAFQREPINLIWATLSDGSLLCCTYIPDQNFQAWSYHQTQGEVVSITTMQTKQGFDRLWAVTRRTIGDGTTRQCIEIMDDNRTYNADPNAENSFFVDCGLTALLDEESTVIEGLEHLEGLKVAVLADNAVVAGYDIDGSDNLKTVRNGAITLDVPAKNVHVGLPYRSRLKTLDLELPNQGTLRGAGRQPWQITVELDNCRELWYSVNGSKFHEHHLQLGESMGLELQPISGDVRLNPLPANNRHSYYTFDSPNPVSWGLRSLVAEISYDNP